MPAAPGAQRRLRPTVLGSSSRTTRPADLLECALDAQEEDAGSTVVDQYDVLVALADVRQRAGNWLALRSVVHRGIEAADALDDVDRLARIAVMPSTGALWQAAHHGEVDPVVTAALRRALDRLPPGDGALRCRVMLSLSGELYYGVGPREREALADEAVAMARRLGDRALLMIACQSASISILRAATAEQRFALAQESVRLAEELGDESALVVSLTLVATVSADLGKVDLMEETAALAREHAEKLRHLYAILVLDNLEMAWTTLRGEFERVEGPGSAHAQRGGAHGSRPVQRRPGSSLAGPAHVATRYDEVMTVLSRVQGDVAVPMTASHVRILVRSGRVDEARAYLQDHPIDLEPDLWYSPLTWGLAAEIALAVGDPDLGARRTNASPA
jgi:hypothetical protein